MVKPVKSRAARAGALVVAAVLVAVMAIPASAAVGEQSPWPLALRSFGHWFVEVVTQTFDGLESVWSALGGGIDPNGVQSACSSNDPLCNPEVGVGADPDG
jgi:hypothetical protein